ncbi:MAG: hypothetical protein RR420_08485 [Anaerovoracaceae bacterium]
MNGYLLGILWGLGTYQEEGTIFLVRHKDKFFPEFVREELREAKGIRSEIERGDCTGKEDFREFIISCKRTSYLLGKLVGQSKKEYDAKTTLENVKEEIINVWEA